MAAVWELASSTFWSTWFWLPEGYTWNDFKNVEDGRYIPQASDLLVSIPLAILLCVIRILFERYVARPIGRSCGLKDTSPKCRPCPVLEEIYKKKKQPNYSEIEGVSKQTDLSVRQIERWFRIRRVQGRPTILSKFGEASWRFIFYLTVFWYGVYILYKKPWAWESRQWWGGFPRHHVSDDMYWYYALEMGFYLSLLMSLFRDVKRKDFMEMVVHHIATLGLIFMSWSQNMVRVGCMVLVVHDAVDYWLEGAKMSKYIKRQKWCDTLFVVFLLIWIVTRLAVFPFWIIRSTLFEAHPIVGFCNIYFVYNILLITLQILHIFWTIIIFRMAYDGLKKGELQNDNRSASDEEISEESDSVNSISKHQGKNSKIISKQNGRISCKTNGSTKMS